MVREVEYKQGMTEVWSDGEKITVRNKSGIKWVETNVEQIFGMGEWHNIQHVAYMEVHHAKNRHNKIRTYECVSGYIPQRVFDDLAELPEEELPDDEKKKATLEALKNDT